MSTKIIVEVILNPTPTPNPTPKPKPTVPIALLTTNFGSGGQNNDVTYIYTNEKEILKNSKK